MTSTEQNRSHKSEQASQNDSDATGQATVNRRTCLKMAGVAAASLAGCTGKASPNSGQPAGFGYGGGKKVTNQLAAVDVSEVIENNNIANSVSTLSLDSPLSTTLSPGKSDLFAFTPRSDSDVTIRYNPASEMGVTALGIFDPDGEIISQAYASSEAPVYLPESISTEGTHYIQVMDVSQIGGSYSLSVSEESLTTQSQSPYEGTVASIPGRIQAQNFDIGGEGVGYHDTTSGNEYDTSYRDSDVDIRQTQDSSGEYNIGYFEDGEWLEYTVDVTPGTYNIHVRVATPRSDRRLELSFGDKTLGTVTVSNTGGWTSWETVTLEDIKIDTDEQSTLRVEALDSGIDFNWLEFEAVDTKGPYNGSPATIPGRIEAENYDTGGEGIGYHDTTSGNEYDTSYRDSDVDIRQTQDSSGEYNIGYFEDGEWLEYTTDVSPGTYDIRVRVATTNSDRQLRFHLNGQELATVDVPNTGDWTAWETATLDGVSIDADGQHVLRVEAVGSGIDFNWAKFKAVDDGQSAYNAHTLPGRIQAQDFDIGGEGVGYHDTTSGNEYDTSYRDSDVDIRQTQDSSGEYNIGYFEDGEWLKYTAEIPSGTYDVNVRVATTRSDRQLQVSLDDKQVGTIDVPNTGGWYTWETTTLSGVKVESGGEHVLRIKAVGSGIDFNWIEFLESESGTETDSDDDFGEQGYGMGGYGGTQ